MSPSIQKSTPLKCVIRANPWVSIPVIGVPVFLPANPPPVLRSRDAYIMRMSTPFFDELQDALAAARQAGEFIMAAYHDFTPIPDAPANISTDIDRGSQDLILNYLRTNYPGDALCAEETTASKDTANAGASRCWVVDPIDGTRGFVMKNGEFSVMIALTVDTRPVVGVVLEPATGIVTFASQGGGCWTESADGVPRRCHVKTVSKLDAITVVQSHTKPGSPSMPVEKLKPAKVLEMYSAGVKMAVVARGEADLYANTYGKFADWDICAGDILVTEAGGVVSGLIGEPITYGKPGFAQESGLIACSSAIHVTAMERLR